MLKVTDMRASYGKSQVLRGVSLQVGAGEIVALLGRNGAGRSTTAKALMGLIEAQGLVLWKGQNLLSKPPHQIARLGLGYVPETRDVFPNLTVEQNLVLGRKPGVRYGCSQGNWSLDDAYAMFPVLQTRRHTQAGVLSGGEQQILSMCRTLMGRPELVIVDEPAEGLAPQLVVQVAELLKALRAQGVSVLLIEQKLSIALAISDRCYVLGRGRVVFSGTPAELLTRHDVQGEWLSA
jgi:branched-chain amino acid transport system ATP-binding protein